MERQQWVHRRKGRYMAQLLEVFEEQVEPWVPKAQADAFKALTRRKLNALAVDCCELMDLEGEEINGIGQDLRDRLFPDGRPARKLGAESK